MLSLLRLKHRTELYNKSEYTKTMSISAPEAHHTHLPENVIRGAEDYADELADLSGSNTNLSVGDQTADVALRALEVEQGNAADKSRPNDAVPEPDL
jgi:hypothetical protein